MELGTWLKPAVPTNAAKLLSSAAAHKNAVEALAFSEDRRLLASAGTDETGNLWDVAGSKPRVWSVFRKSGEKCCSLAFSSNRRMLAAGNSSGRISLYNVAETTTQEIRVLRGGQGAIDALAFSSDGKYLAGAGEDQQLRVWEPGASTGSEARITLPGHSGRIRALAFAPDGQSVATAGVDGTVRVWSLNWIRVSQKMCLNHRGEVRHLAFSPDGRTLASAVRSGGVWLWDLQAARPTVICELNNDLTGDPRLVLIPADGHSVVCVGEQPRVLHWNLRSRRPDQAWELPAGTGESFAVTADGRYLARGLSTGVVEIFRIAEKRR